VAVDSHLDLPVIGRIQTDELDPYRGLAAEADAVMVGHLLVPEVDEDHPASLSPAVIGGLLRGRIGFGGLVCTDALVMGGVTKRYAPEEMLERAAAAGADVLLYPEDPFQAVSVLEEAVLQGRLSAEDMDASIRRILAAKEKAGLFEERMVDVALVEQRVGSEEHRAAAQKVADAAVTLARGSARVEGSAAYLHLTDGAGRGDLSVFRGELERGVKIDDSAETCVAAVFFRPRAFAGKSRLDGHLVERMAEARCRHRRLIVVSFGSPYVLGQVPEADAGVCAYGEDPFSQRAAARALAGEIPFSGRLPLQLIK
jgi:beta-N-acetylhexosaminidase